MPFKYGPYPFSENEINTKIETGGVYSLARPIRVGELLASRFTIVYVGKVSNLRKRLKDHLCNPPLSGITHFFAEGHDTDAARTLREYALIQEFKPVGNTLLK
jgi:hypothetical protein